MKTFPLLLLIMLSTILMSSKCSKMRRAVKKTPTTKSIDNIDAEKTISTEEALILLRAKRRLQDSTFSNN